MSSRSKKTGTPPAAKPTAIDKIFMGAGTFIAGAATTDAIPETSLLEIAFAGRSNVGKSSLLNALTGRKSLARTSRSPGRTQQINFFAIGEHFMLVDLPGYGYAQVSAGQLRQWRQLISHYLSNRVNLRQVLALVDSRHGFLDNDRLLMDMLNEAAVPFQIVLTKADKIGVTEQSERIAEIRKELKKQPAARPEPILVSSQSGLGISMLRDAIIQAIS